MQKQGAAQGSGLKDKLILIATFAAMVLIIISYAPAMHAATEGFTLWVTAVMPGLFPFFVCSHVVVNGLSSGRRGGLAGMFMLSAVSGAPGGARLAASLYGDDPNMDIIVAGTNMLSPMFIAGTLSYTVLNEPACAIPIAIGHYISALCVTLVGRYVFKAKPAALPFATCGRDFLGSLGEGIKQGFSSSLLVCGTIVFFMVLTTVLESAGLTGIMARPFVMLGADYNAVRALILAVLEVSTGINALGEVSGLSMGAVASIASAMVSFGGVCIFMQARNFVKLNPLRYFLAKAAQGVAAGAICYFVSGFFELNRAVFEPIGTQQLAGNAISLGSIAVSAALPLCAVAVIAYAMRRR